MIKNLENPTNSIPNKKPPVMEVLVPKAGLEPAPGVSQTGF